MRTRATPCGGQDRRAKSRGGIPMARSRKPHRPAPQVAELRRLVARVDELESFQGLVEQVSDYAIFMLDPRGFVRTWNRGAERIKGYRAEEIVGSHFSRFYTEADRREGKPERVLAEAAAQGRVEDE